MWANQTVERKAEPRFWVKNFTPVAGSLSILKFLLVLIPVSFQDKRRPWLAGVRGSEAPREKKRQKPTIFRWPKLMKPKE